MKKLRFLLALTIIFVLATSMAMADITIRDTMDREITLSEPATRVIALEPSDCEILFALGCGDAVVGRGQYCDYPEEVANIPSVNSGTDINIEEIIALEPQLVIMTKMAHDPALLEKFENTGIQVVTTDSQKIEDIYSNIALLGKLMGTEENADKIVEGMKDGFKAITDMVADKTSDEKSLYFEVSPLQYGLWTAGQGTFMNELSDMINIKNCFGDLENWKEISEEQVIERNPDYIVTISMYFGEGPTPEEEILSRKGWEEITALKNNAILNIDTNLLSRPAPRLVEGLQELYDFVYGK